MMTPFPYDVIGHWMSKHKLDIPSEAYHDLAELFVEYSENEEYDSDKEVVGSDCLCVLGSKKHNPECEYAGTPAHKPSTKP